VTVLAACALSGCATSGALETVDARSVELEAKVETLSSNLEKMQTTLQDVTNKLNEQNKDMTDMNTSVKAALDKIGTLDKRLTALREDTDKRFEESAKRAGKTEAEVTSAGKQLAAFKTEMARLDDQFKKIGSVVGQAQSLILKNLENARDIYKTQFLALDELLQNLNKARGPEKEDKKPPAEK
jgi:chromosome segregation ATPase